MDQADGLVPRDGFGDDGGDQHGEVDVFGAGAGDEVVGDVDGAGGGGEGLIEGGVSGSYVVAGQFVEVVEGVHG